MKRFKGPKMDSLHFTSLFSLFTSLHKYRGRRSIAGIKESFKGKYSTCKTSAGVNLQGKSFQNFTLNFNCPMKFLIEIPDFRGNSRRNHPEPEGNFQKFPEGEEGDFCEFPTQNQEFLINSDFYFSYSLPKCKSHLCSPARVSKFSTCEEIAHLGGQLA